MDPNNTNAVNQNSKSRDGTARFKSETTFVGSLLVLHVEVRTYVRTCVVGCEQAVSTGHHYLTGDQAGESTREKKNGGNCLELARES